MVNRLQFFEFFGSDGDLRWKKLLPMEFELIEEDHFESMARDAGFQVLDLYGNYDRSSFEAVAHDPSGHPKTHEKVQWELATRNTELGTFQGRRQNGVFGSLRAGNRRASLEWLKCNVST